MWGDLRVSELEPNDVLTLRDRRCDKPAAANYLIRVLSLVISFIGARHPPQPKSAQGARAAVSNARREPHVRGLALDQQKPVLCVPGFANWVHDPSGESKRQG